MQWKGLAREGVSKAIRGSGVPLAIRLAHRQRATIAFYHDPTPAVFEAHLRYLSRRFSFTTLDEIVDALRSGDWSRLPERALAVTLDDGHRGNHALLPLFQRYGLRPTIYVCSQIVGTSRGFWFNEPVATQALKRVPNAERLAVLRRQTGFEPEFPRPGARQALSQDEMREMAPWVDFGSHTRFHPILPRCSDAEAQLEIEGSKRDLEQMLDRPCRHHCFPNGDYQEREIDLARKAGYQSARTTDVGWVGPSSDVWRLKVAGITDSASLDMLAVQLSGIPRFARNLAHGRLGGGWQTTPAATS